MADRFVLGAVTPWEVVVAITGGCLVAPGWPVDLDQHEVTPDATLITSYWVSIFLYRTAMMDRRLTVTVSVSGRRRARG